MIYTPVLITKDIIFKIKYKQEETWKTRKNTSRKNTWK